MVGLGCSVLRHVVGCEYRPESGAQVGGTATPQPTPASGEQRLAPRALCPKVAQSGSGSKDPFQTLVVQVPSSPRAATSTLPHTAFVSSGGRCVFLISKPATKVVLGKLRFYRNPSLPKVHPWLPLP